MNIAVVAAHPDDEILGCGATIASLSKENDVRILILGEGVTSRAARRSAAARASAKNLKENAREAAKSVGAKDVTFLDFPDQRLDLLALLDIIKPVDAWLSAFRPQRIYTHHPGDLNIDHGLTFRAVLTATRPTNPAWVPDIYAFEIPSSTEWALQRLEPVFRPNTFVDISRWMGRKIEAMRAYKSEMRPFPHPRSAQALRAIAQRWGTVIGRRYAEAFELIRSVR